MDPRKMFAKSGRGESEEEGLGEASKSSRFSAFGHGSGSGLGIASLVASLGGGEKKQHKAMGDGKLVRSEFVDLCIDVMWGLPSANLEMAVQNYLEAKSMETRRNAEYWKAFAREIDEYSRFWVCVSYGFIMCLLFSIQFTDNYEDETVTTMFTGAPYSRIHQQNVWVALTFIFVFIGMMISYIIPKYLIQKRLEAYERAERERWERGQVLHSVASVG